MTTTASYYLPNPQEGQVVKLNGLTLTVLDVKETKREKEDGSGILTLALCQVEAPWWED